MVTTHCALIPEIASAFFRPFAGTVSTSRRHLEGAVRNNFTFVKLVFASRARTAMPEDDLSIKAERALVAVALSTTMLIICLGSLLYR